MSAPWSLGFQHGDIAHHEVHAGSPEPHPTLVAVTVAGGATIRNGIMLVSHIRYLQTEEGVTDFRTAVVHGVTKRVVPIRMTALAAGLALVPIALSAGKPGAKFRHRWRW